MQARRKRLDDVPRLDALVGFDAEDVSLELRAVSACMAGLTGMGEAQR